MRLAAIHLHPVKSARGIPVSQAEVGPSGLRYDRRWMIVDRSGRFVSQREDPRLGRIAPRLDEVGERLRLRAGGAGELALPLRPGPGEPRAVTIWDDEVIARDCGDAAAEWLATVLGGPYRLVVLPDDAVRPVDPAYARPGDRVSFADGFPYLLASEASLEDLERRAGTRLTMARFRPNLVVAGSAPFAEDGWSRIRVGAVPFRVAKPCARCVVPTLDPDTQEAGAEPLRTLATYRKVDGKVMFGQNLLPDGGGVIRVGDAVEVEAEVEVDGATDPGPLGGE
jgi:uncharacterized protein YcbX